MHRNSVDLRNELTHRDAECGIGQRLDDGHTERLAQEKTDLSALLHASALAKRFGNVEFTDLLQPSPEDRASCNCL